eukprot:4306187-Alexandrium_andersonii.AAC.1
MSSLTNAHRRALRTSTRRAFRAPERRPRAQARPLVARSDRSKRRASSGGVATNIASSFQYAMSLATYRRRTLGFVASPLFVVYPPYANRVLPRARPAL